MIPSPQFKVLERWARGRPCEVRLFPLCDGGGETSVWAHPPTGVAIGKGMGIKASGLLGSVACFHCHAEVDRRTLNIEPELAWLAFWEGHARSLVKLYEDGLIRVG